MILQMRLSKFYYLLGLLLIIGTFSCKNKSKKEAGYTGQPSVFKGLYSLEPGEKIFKDCANGHEFWVADSSAQLELKYSQLVSFEKQGDPVYVELEGKLIHSAKDGAGAQYDTTLVVKKVITITKDIPKGKCN
jgi:hypothetical protein